MSSKVLLAFDFDKTITDKNTDMIAFEILPKEDQKKLWNEFYEKGEWTKFMNDVFKQLSHKNVSVEELQSKIRLMVLNNGLQELFQYIQANNELYDCIIISDSNSWFIDTILETHNLKSAIKKIFANPATIVENKRLHLIPCHSHTHSSCPNNMCKGKLLQNFIKANGIHYSKICYFGDGSNDFCPCLTLQNSDVIFPRKGFPLHQKLNETHQTGKTTVKAKVIPWENGLEILDSLITLNIAA